MSENKLRDDELMLLSEHSGVDIDVVRSWYKDFLLNCPKGKMDKKHFYKFYKLLRGQPEENLNKITDHVFSCFDRDSNGYLDFAEFLIAYSATSNGNLANKLEFVFSFYDKDKDGILNDKEFLQGVELMYDFRCKSKTGDYTPKKCVRDIFDKIDENGDCKLTREEFIQGCMKNKKIIELLSPFEF